MKETIKITTTDGYPVSVTTFIPKKFNGNVLLINSATGVKQTFYSDYATSLAEQGFRVYTYDYRGIGASRPSSLKGFQATMHEWGAKDYHAVLKYLFMAWPDAKFIVMGHSVGGQIVGMSPLSENVDLFILAGAQTPYWRNFESKKTMFVFWYLMIPVFTRLFGYFPASRLGLFEDLPAGVARQWARWAKSPDYVFEEMSYLKERFTALHQPALMVSFSDDKLAPKLSVDQLIGFYKNLKWTHMHLKPEELSQSEVGHFGLFKKNMGAPLWNDIISWINESLHIKENKAA